MVYNIYIICYQIEIFNFMIIGILKEKYTGEKRVPLTPDSVKKIIDLGYEICFENNCGIDSNFLNQDYINAGGILKENYRDVINHSDILIKVNLLVDDEIQILKPNQILIGLFQPYNADYIEKLKSKKTIIYALEKLPRISRAQSMDILSSQANLSGYKSVLIAANKYSKIFPMLMTSAGSLKPARLLVMGIGVAGLQAIATAKRLGCIVEATDLRPETKEQSESLGAKFLDVPLTDEEKKILENSGGYAPDLGEDYKERQKKLISKSISNSDIIITTALIPGKKAPILISSEDILSMKSGSIILDMASEHGGNTSLTQPNSEIVTENGVNILGVANIPSTCPADSSFLFSNNIFNFIKAVFQIDKSENTIINIDNELIDSTLV